MGGVALEVLMERVPELLERDLSARDLRSARAIVCTNAVRGVRPLASLDGRPVGGADHPWIRRLGDALAAETGGRRA